MALDVPAIQRALRDSRLDGWLLYDFHGSNPIATRLTGRRSRRPSDHAALVLPDSARRRAPRAGARDRAPQPRRPAGPETGLRPPRSARIGAHGPAARGQDAWRWSTPPAAPSPMSRGSTPARRKPIRARGVDIVSSGDLVQAFEAVWTPAQLETHSDGGGSAVPDQGSGIRGRRGRRPRAGARSTNTGCSSRWWAGSPRKGWSRTRPRWSPSGPHAGNPHYLPTAASASPIVADQLLLLDLWGKLAQPAAVFADITWVGYHRPHRARENGRGVCRRRPRARCRGRAGAGRGQGRAGAAGVGSRSRGPDGAGRRGVRGPGLAPHRPQPGRRASTATVRISTTSRPATSAGCCQGPASRSSLASIWTNSACARKSTSSAGTGRPK